MRVNEIPFCFAGSVVAFSIPPKSGVFHEQDAGRMLAEVEGPLDQTLGPERRRTDGLLHVLLEHHEEADPPG